MENLDKLIAAGKSLGLEGDKLLQFVHEREERELKEKSDAIAREERLRDREQKKLEQEAQFKLEMLNKEIELQKARAETTPPPQPVPDVKAKIPKLPPFNEQRDNMDAYLKRFERFAESAGWDRSRWATNLSALLQGTALDVYSRLSGTEALDYDILRTSLLKRFQLTEEGFRLKFRKSTPEKGETASQFVTRLDSYLKRWMNLAKVEETYDGIRDLFLREQFMNSVQKNLQIFLKEHKIQSVKAMVELAEQYNEAHGMYGEPSFGKYQKNVISNTQKSISHPDNQTPKVVNPRERYCYSCHSSDHFVKNCPSKRSSLSQPKTAGMINTESVNSRKSQSNYRDKGVSNRGQGRGQSNGNLNARKYNREDVEQIDKDETNLKSAASCVVQDIGALHKCCTVDSRVPLKCGHDLPLLSAACKNSGCQWIAENVMPVEIGYVGPHKVNVLRDSGCSSAVVKLSLVDPKEMTGKCKHCVLIDGTVKKVEVAKIDVDTPFYKGELEVLCMENPIYDLIIGNVAGVKDPFCQSDKEIGLKVERNDDRIDMESNKNATVDNIDIDEVVDITQSVQTRAQREREKKGPKPLKVSDQISDISPAEIIKAQQEDETLNVPRQRAESGEKKTYKNGSVFWYIYQGDMLYREFQSDKVEHGRVYKQLVVPKMYRNQILKLGHDSLFSGHLGVKKMTEKVLNEFHWPGVQGDIIRYCRSCDICQRTFPKGKVSKIPVGEMPLIETPFSRVAIDLIGPIHPPTERGHRFILTLVDFASRYPEAIPLKRIDTETVAEAMLEIFSRVGFPREILTDLGKQFTSECMHEVCRLASISHLTTTPYHAQCNGLVERYNGTLKMMLKKMCEEQPTQWDRYISPLLFAYREAKQESLGFSPFEIIYGKSVRGPLTILKELWTKDVPQDEVKTTYQYVLDLNERLEETMKIAQSELRKSQKKYRHYANQKTRDRQFKVGDKVLLLLPTDNNKLLMQWKGPYDVTERVTNQDYRINMKGKSRLFHANMLKKYIQREDGNAVLVTSPQVDKVNTGLMAQVCVAVIDEEMDENQQDNLQRNIKVDLPNFQAQESLDDIKINPELSESQKTELKSLVTEFKDVITDIPGSTDLIEHEIRLTSNEPVRSKPYTAPYALNQCIKDEIKSMLQMGIIEPSTSPYASPVVIVKKADGSNRFCIDYRRLNCITVFDAEPIGNPDVIFTRLGKSKYFTKLDLAKGYWQIKMKDSCIHLTAFITSDGLFAFRRMPFGLVNSGATFSRMMRKLLYDLEQTEHFVDDVMEHTETWEFHLVCLRKLLSRLRGANLTVKPSKCMFGFTSVTFLGHVVGKGLLSPNPEKLTQIEQTPRPTTKKEVRSFLGLIGYYQKFIPNFSAIASPLTDLTRKGNPNIVIWEQEHENAYKALTGALSKPPVLRLPQFDQVFILRTDASNYGLGAVILQEHEDMKFPVFYASRKLKGPELHYSVIEKECFAVVWSIQKFQPYLYGREFILETDHQPLLYINRAKVTNPRIMRWALALQPYRFSVRAIKGSENLGADFLSRTLP